MPFLKDTNAPIALFDSGAGGIGVLQEVKKLLPSEQFLYFGDTKNAPYGERTHKEIAALVKSAAATMIPHTKALVLACNTATAVAAEELRNAYPDYPIIGMEPAVALAARMKHTRILVLATAATLREKRFVTLCQKHEKVATVLPISAPGIVRLVEMGLSDSPEMDGYLCALSAQLPFSPDAIVLGCTHFPFARNSLQRVFGNIPLYDGAAGTAMELRRQLQKRGLLSPATAAGGTTIFTSNPRSLPLLIELYKK